MPKTISAETKDAIIRAYLNEASYDEIRGKFECSDSTIARIAKKCGLSRYGNRQIVNVPELTKKTNVEKICPKCRKPVEVHGARFCPWCGSDVRSERQIVAEELEKVLKTVCDMSVPAEEKDRACNSLRNAARLLREESVE